MERVYGRESRLSITALSFLKRKIDIINPPRRFSCVRGLQLPRRRWISSRLRSILLFVLLPTHNAQPKQPQLNVALQFRGEQYVLVSTIAG
jgi:hypothetical protein